MSPKLRLNFCFLGGYGAFKDRKIDFLENNFILVYGKNETGKSTLFSFLRGMIASFPPLKKRTENRYLPLNGGEYGGELEVMFNDKPHTLKKSGKDLSSICISGELEKDYFAFSNSIDREHYKAVFGFDLSELTSLKLLDDTSLNERLFSSFIEGSEDVVSSALKALDKSKQELFKARADSKIDRLYKEFVVGETRIRELENEVEVRASRVVNLSELEVGIEKKKLERSSILAKLEELQDQKEASMIVESLQKEEKLRDKLSQLPTISGEEEAIYRENLNRLNILKYEHGILSSENEKLKSNKHLLDQKVELLNLGELEGYKRACTIEKRFYYLGLLLVPLFLIFYYVISPYFSLEYLSSLPKTDGDGDDFSGLTNVAAPLMFQLFTAVSFLLALFTIIGMYFYYRKERNSFIPRIQTFADKMGCDLSDIDRLTGEYILLKRDRELVIVRLKEVDLGIQKSNSQMEEYFRHPLAHLLESDVVELRESGQKLNDSLTRISTLKEALSSLKLDVSLALADNTALVHELNLNLSRVSKELDQLLEERGLLKASIEELSTSSKLQELRLDVYSLKSEIERLLFAWRVDAFSEYLLAEALKKVGESAFKNVSLTASEIFKSITLNGYQEVNLGSKGNNIVVKDSVGKTLEPSQLSQGTVEQLYLSLRLALVKVSKDSLGTLPILLDDVLVNFDKERAKAIIKVLAEMSKDNQVFYFTCHEWIREIYLEVVGGEGVVEV